MSATIATVTMGLPNLPVMSEEVQRLWFFPNGSEHLRRPHFHAIYESGFRQNLPLSVMFTLVYNGKLSVKDYWGKTNQRIEVINQIWYVRGAQRRAQGAYALILPLSVDRRRQRV
jgi:hypothetical protein